MQLGTLAMGEIPTGKDMSTRLLPRNCQAFSFRALARSMRVEKGED